MLYTCRPIVIDVGSFSIKAGYAQGPPFVPSIVVPTPGNGIFGDKKGNPLVDPRGVVHSEAFKSGEMVDIWRSVFERLGTTPEKHNATGGGVLLCTSWHAPKESMPAGMIAEAMFETLGVQKLYLSCKSALALHAHGLVEGVAVNCGHSGINIYSVAKDWLGPPRNSSAEANSAQISGGARDIIAKLAHSFELPMHHACDFMKQHCFVPLDFMAPWQPESDADELTFQPNTFDFDTSTLDPIVVGPGDFRRKYLYLHSEALFRDVNIGHTNEGLSSHITRQQFVRQMAEAAAQGVTNPPQPGVVLTAASKVECNIVLSGGLSNLTGLKERIEQDIEARYPCGSESTLQVEVSKSERPEFDVWKGGALLALALTDDEWYTRSTYEEYGPEPLLSRGRSHLRPRGGAPQDGYEF